MAQRQERIRPACALELDPGPPADQAYLRCAFLFYQLRKIRRFCLLTFECAAHTKLSQVMPRVTALLPFPRDSQPLLGTDGRVRGSHEGVQVTPSSAPHMLPFPYPSNSCLNGHSFCFFSFFFWIDICFVFEHLFF